MSDELVTVEMVDIESVVPYPRNAKLHSLAQIDKLAGLIAAFGFDQPIVVDGQGTIIKGHARREAALKLGMRQVPVIVSHLTEDQARVARIADNSARSLEYDDELLRFEVGTLTRTELDTRLFGMGLAELDRHMAALSREEMPAISAGRGDNKATDASTVWLGEERFEVTEEETILIEKRFREFLDEGRTEGFVGWLCGA